jgi:hypothetical protein
MMGAHPPSEPFAPGVMAMLAALFGSRGPAPEMPFPRLPQSDRTGMPRRALPPAQPGMGHVQPLPPAMPGQRRRRPVAAADPAEQLIGLIR